MAEAHKSLRQLRNKKTSTDLIEADFEEIVETLETEKRLTEGVAILDLLRKANPRRTLLSVALLICLIGTGALFFLAYGTYFFAVAGQTKAFQENVGMTIAGLVATLFSMCLMTMVGRRTIRLLGFALQALCTIILAAVDSHALTKTVGQVLIASTNTIRAGKSFPSSSSLCRCS